MGIVAFCPTGHRVKVKDHLAGKKGICPHCGLTFRIPAATTAKHARPAAAAGLPRATVVSLDPSAAASLPPVIALADSQPEGVAEPDPTARAEELPVAVAGDSAAPEPRPIAEAPWATWCWAVPGGQPSAQMSAAEMAAWLESGAVTGAELVWRSDWAGWVSVREVFPERCPSWPATDFLRS